MTTQEEIEAAVERCNRAIVNVSWDTSGVGEYRSGKHNWISDCAIITRAYLAERQQRERDGQPPTREMFERLNISDYCGTLEWDRDHRFPRFYADGWFVEIPTVARLRAACLLLGIDTEGIL